MKVLLILALILLLIGTVVGELIIKDPGYVLLSYQQTTIETSIWGLVMISVIGFLLLHLALRLLKFVLERRQKLHEWRQKRSRIRANRRTTRGLNALAAGQWAKAHWLLIDGVEHSDMPLVNYTQAAWAANEQGEENACDRYLQQAYKALPKSETAISLVQAQIQLSRGELEPCLATLKRIHSSHSKHTQVLRMLAEVYQRQQDWEALSELLPQLQKQQVFTEAELDAMERNVYLSLLNQSVIGLTVETDEEQREKVITQRWKELPKELNQDPGLATRYARLLEENGAEERAESFIRDALKHDWNEDLVRLYGQINGGSPAKQLKVAESWLDKYPENAILLLTLGRLSLQNHQWQQARDYFEQSLALDKSQETYHELARLLPRLEGEGSYQTLMANLDSVTANLPKLPLPDMDTDEQPQADAGEDAASADKQAS